MHEHLKSFKFVRGCDTTVPILYINLIKYVRTFFLVITGSPQYKQAPGSFIFSLRNKEDLPPFKAPLKDQNTPFAIYTYHTYGPTFGGGYDLFIYNNATSNTSSYTQILITTTKLHLVSATQAPSWQEPTTFNHQKLKFCILFRSDPNIYSYTKYSYFSN
jgi:hypothetical protein